MKIFWYVLLSLFLFSCTQDNTILIYKNNKIIKVTNDIVVETQKSLPQNLDIIFYIDQSGSMGEEHIILTPMLEEFYTQLTGLGYDDLRWKVGFRTTDPRELLMENWTDYNDPDAYSTLQRLARLENSNPMDGEAGLEAAVTSITNDNDFHRVDSILLNIFISDEKDQSINITIQDYKSLMTSFKAAPFKVLSSSIVFKDPINYCGWGDSIGHGYLEISETSIDLCDTIHWVTALDLAKKEVLKLNKVLELEYIPSDKDSIQVYVEEQEWIQGLGWHYDSINNAVIMDILPPDNSVIFITYLI